jgi:hypothetical protein
LLFFLVSASVYAAGITITAVTPNPGGVPSLLRGEGDINLGMGEEAIGVEFLTTDKKTGQIAVNFFPLAKNAAKWSADLAVVPATYNPHKAYLHFKDLNGVAKKLTIPAIYNVDKTVK